MTSTDKIICSCPCCSKRFELSHELIGAKGKCDACETRFIITADEIPVVPPVPVAGPHSSKKKGAPIGVFVVLALLAGLGYFGYNELVLKKKDSGDEVVELKKTNEKKSAVKVTQTPQARPEKSLAGLKKTFPVFTKFREINMREYRSTYPNPYLGWMPHKKEESAKALDWGHHLGPLGVRVRSHAPQLQGRPAFAENVPNSIRTQEGELGLTAAEVVAIAQGSPADGYLKKGDLIIGVEGEMLKSGDAYRPDWKFMHKDRRELQLMLGEKIDKAQGRGDIRLTVLRYPAERIEVFSQSFGGNSDRVQTEKIPVSEGDEVHLIVDPEGNNEWDHFAWLSPRFTGSAGTLDLTDEKNLKPKVATSGWGDVLYGKTVEGEKLSEKGIGLHARSLVVFKVPKGYTSFQTAMKTTNVRSDVEARVMVVKPQQRLAVSKKEIWSGSSGNKDLGIQSFSTEVAGEGFITLRSDQSTDGNGGDGTLWMDVVVEGSYGTKKLFDLPWTKAWAGHGRAKIEKDQEFLWNGQKFEQVLRLHATGEAVWRLPKGTKKVSGYFAGTSYGLVQPIVYLTNEALPLTGIHKDKVVELRFPIGKTGSYSDTYPKDCPKSEITVTRHTAWLAAQQRENGSWPRLGGYTTDGWDTAWCALALMSSGDSKYDEQVRKAAYYIGYENGPSEWTAERAMRLIFLSEYYLRTKDTKILAAIQASYRQLEACCKTDNMAGHKVNGFGYGIAGQHYGTGHMALAFAVASKTPIETNGDLVKDVIRHAGEVCVNGTYAYGRGRRFARDDSRKHGGGNTMIGPGMLGAMIAGGHQSSIDEAIERWDASVGDADNSHATSSLGFILASLAMATENEEVFLKSMQNFKYKMTLDDNWEGGFLKSSFALDLQSGDGVVANWIWTAGDILVLNALKHNLAITGKSEFIEKKRIQSDAVSEWGGQIHSYYLRNWCITKELLGKNAPKGLSKTISELHGLPRTMELVPKTRELVLKYAPKLISQISNNRAISDRNKAYAIELLCGLDFKIYTKLDGEKQKVDLHVNQPLHQLNWLDKDKDELYAESPFKLEAKVVISGKRLDNAITFEMNGLKGFNLDQGTRTFKVSKELKPRGKKEFDGTADISFKIGQTRVNYKRPLKFNSEMSHSNHINLRRFRLKLRMAPRAYFQSQPLMIAGIAFDCMYPAERMMTVSGPKKGTINIHEGDVVMADIASENFICAWVHALNFPKMTQVKIAKAKEQRTIRGSIEGDIKNLYDFDYDTHCEIKSEGGKSVIEYDFGQPVTLNGLDANYGGSCFIRIWYKNGGTWIPAVWDNYSPNTSHNPTFPDTKAKLWRVEVKPGRGKRFHTLRFYFNPNRIIEQSPLIQGLPENFSSSDISQGDYVKEPQVGETM